jgi:hypothetical protein
MVKVITSLTEIIIHAFTKDNHPILIFPTWYGLPNIKVVNKLGPNTFKTWTNDYNQIDNWSCHILMTIEW